MVSTREGRAVNALVASPKRARLPIAPISAQPPAALDILYPSARQLSPKALPFVAFVRENIVVPV
jgi:hypothetical protein